MPHLSTPSVCPQNMYKGGGGCDSAALLYLRPPIWSRAAPHMVMCGRKAVLKLGLMLGIDVED